MAITKVTNSVLSSGSAADGYVLTADGSGNSAWEAAAGGGVDGIVSSADATAITIDINENVGIGTTTPTTKLHVEGTAKFTDFVYGNGAGKLNINDDVAIVAGKKLYLDGGSNTYLHQVSADEMAFITDGIERMRINSLGYTKYTTVGAYVNLSGTYHETIGSHASIAYYIYNTNSSGDVLFLNSSNENSSNFFLRGYSDNVGRDNIFIYSNGNVVNRNNSYGSLSDQKLKQDIEDANSQWEDIKAIPFRKYRWKQDVASNADAPYQLGVIAQELEAAGMHGLVEETDDKEFYDEVVLDENGNPVLDENGNNVTQREERLTGESTKSVKYSILTLKALKALQEAMERIETLEAKITTLENS